MQVFSILEDYRIQTEKAAAMKRHPAGQFTLGRRELAFANAASKLARELWTTLSGAQAEPMPNWDQLGSYIERLAGEHQLSPKKRVHLQELLQLAILDGSA